MVKQKLEGNNRKETKWHRDTEFTWRPSPNSIFLASVISGILSFMGRGYPRVSITFGLLSKSQMFPLKRCMPGGTQALKSLGWAKRASGGGCMRCNKIRKKQRVKI
jgi:hypothetical protein